MLGLQHACKVCYVNLHVNRHYLKAHRIRILKEISSFEDHFKRDGVNRKFLMWSEGGRD